MEVSVNDRLGVLGGMGPQATNTFYQLVIDRTDAHTDQEHVNALILSDCQMPDRTAAILGTAEEQEAVFRRLLADARLLEGAGCTVLAVPCNTSHFFLDRVQEHIGVPILNMIRETAAALKRQGRTRPGILATDGTIRSGLGLQDMDALLELCRTATPKQLTMITAMIRSALEASGE